MITTVPETDEKILMYKIVVNLSYTLETTVNIVYFNRIRRNDHGILGEKLPTGITSSPA